MAGVTLKRSRSHSSSRDVREIWWILRKRSEKRQPKNCETLNRNGTKGDNTRSAWGKTLELAQEERENEAGRCETLDKSGTLRN